jgi:hypothetical protein
MFRIAKIGPINLYFSMVRQLMRKMEARGPVPRFEKLK